MDVLPPEKPLVITIHDLIAEKFPNEFKEEVRIKNQKLINRANRIIAISENTKNDLISYYNISEDKIDVIYHGSPFSAEAVTNSNIENIYGDYLLYVGYRSGYKNFNLFCWALTSVIKDKPQIKVILIGGRNLNKEERELIHSLKLENSIIHYKTVTENQLISLYKNAKAFVFPSKYEGFGFPILEAFSCKTPVICSDRSSLPEIAGNAAYYFNPDDYESIANAILQVINSDELTKTLTQNGTERIKYFNWPTTIEQTLNCYEKTLEASSKQNDRE